MSDQVHTTTRSGSTTSQPSSLHRVWFLLLLVLPLSASAQFQIGVSGGAFLYGFREGSDSRGFTAIKHGAPFSASVWYRERPKERTGFGAEIQYTKRSFQAEYFYGGLGGGTNFNLEVDLSMVHLTAGPEFVLDPEGYSFLRLGLQLGLAVGGVARGTSKSWSMGSQGYITDEVRASASRFFKPDARLQVGFGFEFVISDRWVGSVDPSYSYGIASMTKDQAPTLRTSEFGVRLSLGRRYSGRSIWQILRLGSPKPTG
jgi:hypothetical protein